MPVAVIPNQNDREKIAGKIVETTLASDCTGCYSSCTRC